MTRKLYSWKLFTKVFFLAKFGKIGFFYLAYPQLVLTENQF